MSVKKCSKCKEEKPVDHFNNQTRSKDGKRSDCRACQRLIKVAYYYKHRDRLITDAKNWSSENPERVRQNDINKRINNPALYTAIRAKRRAAKLQATPAWADQKAITAIYAEARRLQETLGIPMHCDHIIPLQGELVCGLHVETNLQVIPAPLNLRKSNKFKVQ